MLGAGCPALHGFPTEVLHTQEVQEPRIAAGARPGGPCKPRLATSGAAAAATRRCRTRHLPPTPFDKQSGGLPFPSMQVLQFSRDLAIPGIEAVPCGCLGG